MTTTWNLLDAATQMGGGIVQGISPPLNGTVTIVVTGSPVGTLYIETSDTGNLITLCDPAEIAVSGRAALTITAAGTYTFTATQLTNMRAHLDRAPSSPVTVTASF